MNCSLNLGINVLFFDLVACFRFCRLFSAGPRRLTSTYGRKTLPAEIDHLKSLAATTAQKRANQDLKYATEIRKITKYNPIW